MGKEENPEVLAKLSTYLDLSSHDLGTIWTCPICSRSVWRKRIKGPDDGNFPDDYDYTLYENDADFLLRIITHICTHISRPSLNTSQIAFDSDGGGNEPV